MPGGQARPSHGRGLLAHPDPDRRQQPDRLRSQPPQGVVERRRARTIKPLKVIDGDNYRTLSGQAAEHPEKSGTDRPVIQPAARRLLQQQRYLQSVLLGYRQLAEHRIANLRQWLDDLSSALPIHSAHSVSESLERWVKWAATPAAAGEANALAQARRQGELWRSLLSGEKRGTDLLASP